METLIRYTNVLSKLNCYETVYPFNAQQICYGSRLVDSA